MARQSGYAQKVTVLSLSRLTKEPARFGRRPHTLDEILRQSAGQTLPRMLIVLILASALVCAFVVARRSASAAAVHIFLPALLLWPDGYGLAIKGVEIDLLQAVSLPIAIAVIWRYAAHWRVTILDILVVLYPVSSCISEWQAGGQSAGLVALVSSLCSVLPPYLIGRVLIEQHALRWPFLRRFTILLASVSVLSVYEYRMESNPFRTLAGRLTELSNGWSIQVRWGHGRIAGPYGHAILAGMLLICGFLFYLGVGGERAILHERPGNPRLSKRKHALIGAALLAGIWMTQSRGPWMGGVFGILLVYAGRAKNVRRSLVRMVLLGACIFAVFAFATERYTAEQQAGATTQDQENAMYRRELITNYVPVVKQGGLFGWGMNFPRIDGQFSIDNEYLRIALEQGYFGLLLFVVTLGRAGFLVLRSGLRAKQPTDIRFSFCLLGAITSIAMTLTTVFLGAQVFSVLFLFFGWAEALKPSLAAAESTVPFSAPSAPVRFAFRRVFS